MDIDDCGVPKTVAFNVAFEGIHQSRSEKQRSSFIMFMKV